MSFVLTPNDELCPLCTRLKCLVGFLQFQLTEIIVRGQTCRSTRTHYLDSKPTSLCSFSLMQNSQQRSNKYQFYSLLFYPTLARIHNLWRLKRALNPNSNTSNAGVLSRNWPTYQFVLLNYLIYQNKQQSQLTITMIMKRP